MLFDQRNRRRLGLSFCIFTNRNEWLAGTEEQRGWSLSSYRDVMNAQSNHINRL